MYKSKMNLWNFKLINYLVYIIILERNQLLIKNKNVGEISKKNKFFFKNKINSLASTCAWCQKLGIRSFTLRTDNGDSKTLCSEVCFNQYRRASFKKNKVRIKKLY